MKLCTKCSIDKPERAFAFKNKKEKTLQSWCRECVKTRDAKTNSTPERKLSIRKAAKASSKRIKDFLLAYKQEHSCSKCGEDRHYVLDFHHIANKSYTIGDAHQRGISVNTLKKEIDKCILLCSNCHREVHYFERQTSNHSA